MQTRERERWRGSTSLGRRPIWEAGGGGGHLVLTRFRSGDEVSERSGGLSRHAWVGLTSLGPSIEQGVGGKSRRGCPCSLPLLPSHSHSRQNGCLAWSGQGWASTNHWRLVWSGYGLVHADFHHWHLLGGEGGRGGGVWVACVGTLRDSLHVSLGGDTRSAGSSRTQPPLTHLPTIFSTPRPFRVAPTTLSR